MILDLSGHDLILDYAMLPSWKIITSLQRLGISHALLPTFLVKGANSAAYTPKNINPSLVLVQPRKIRPYITERLLTGQTKQIFEPFPVCVCEPFLYGFHTEAQYSRL